MTLVRDARVINNRATSRYGAAAGAQVSASRGGGGGARTALQLYTAQNDRHHSE